MTMGICSTAVRLDTAMMLASLMDTSMSFCSIVVHTSCPVSNTANR